MVAATAQLPFTGVLGKGSGRAHTPLAAGLGTAEHLSMHFLFGDHPQETQAHLTIAWGSGKL